MLPEILSWIRLHPAAFHEAYPARLVNNVYFDTPLLRSLDENLSGVASKRKMRLRWYGELAAGVSGVFQVKSRQNLDGWKLSQTLSEPLDLAGAKWGEVVTAIRSDLSESLKGYLDSTGFPIFINRYRRHYFESSDGALRVTVDDGHVVFDQRHSTRVNLEVASLESDRIILECKASSHDRDRLAAVSSGLPLRVGACSKYVLAVEALLYR
jgi:hypothetical protein